MIDGASAMVNSNLSTTSRYLNIHRRGLHLAMQKLEDSRTPKPKQEQQQAAKTDTEPVAQPLHTTDQLAQAVVPDSPASTLPKQTVR